MSKRLKALPDQGLERKIVRHLSSFSISQANTRMQQKITSLHLVATSKMAMAGWLAATVLGVPAWAQNFPVTPQQKATAAQVAQAGVALSELAPNAPDSYTVKRGDTLWAISGIFLKSPWRWPELWGMNLEDISNPHRIYPGQQLELEKSGGRAVLRLGQSGTGHEPTASIKVSPRTRYESLADAAIPTLKNSTIEPFLAEPIVVDENELQSAPRIVAAQEDRVLLTRGDRAYARGQNDTPLLEGKGLPRQFRIFRNATPLKDPDTGEVLAYEAQYLGKASLVQSESTQESSDKNGNTRRDIIPATIDIVAAKEEMRVGDRLVPEPERLFLSYTPRAPEGKVDGRIISVYGSAVVNASQNQVVVINRGRRDGVQSGHVMAILKDGARLVDKTDPARPLLKLPDERNGLLMVFKTFDKVSYALILEITAGVKVGDRLASPGSR
jgi:LysM repeat protein